MGGFVGDWDEGQPRDEDGRWTDEEDEVGEEPDEPEQVSNNGWFGGNVQNGQGWFGGSGQADFALMQASKRGHSKTETLWGREKKKAKKDLRRLKKRFGPPAGSRGWGLW